MPMPILTMERTMETKMTIWMMSLFISEHIMQSPASDKLKYIDLSFGKKNKNMSIPAVGEFFQGDQS